MAKEMCEVTQTPDNSAWGGLVYNLTPYEEQDIQVILHPNQKDSREDRLAVKITDTKTRVVDLGYPEETLDLLRCRRWQSGLRTTLENLDNIIVTATGATMAYISGENRLLLTLGIITTMSGFLKFIIANGSLGSAETRNDLILDIQKLYIEKIRNNFRIT